MNADKKLPIVLDAAIISECWTFAKLAVIQTSKYAEAWLASHLNLHRTGWYSYFGDCQSAYDPIYYEDILTIREIDLFSMDGNQLVEAIKRNIDKKRYALLYTDWNISGAFTALRKINEEVNGRQIYGVSAEDNWAPVFGEIKYSGIACLHSLRLVLNHLLQHGNLPDWYEKLTLSFKKIHEHRMLILLAMNYIVKEWAINTLETTGFINDYRRCCERAEKWYLLALKYETVQNISLPQQIAAELPTAYKEEKEALQKFVSACQTWYSSNYERIS